MAQLISNLDDLPSLLRGGAVAVGNFDGVHVGHARLIQRLTERADRLGGPSVVLTFDPPPVAILVPDRPPSLPLTTIARRSQLLGHLGVDALIAYPTDRRLLSLGPHEFFQQTIVEALGAKAMVEGPNFRFGKNRVGDTRTLRALCQENGIELDIVEPKRDDAQSMISSTRIRELLSQGAVEQVNQWLTQPYSIEGIVTKGAQRGRELGFPTANLSGLRCFSPGHGVYAGTTMVDHQQFATAIHIGPNPTFDEEQAKVEVHIIGWQGTIYGEKLHCTILKKIRNTQRFDSVELLKAQLAKDIFACR